MRILIDECLSPDLVTVARQAGIEAQHVAHIGKAGWKDWNVLRHARDGDFILVTNDAGDFRKLYATQPLHAGLIILLPSVNRVAQEQLFRGALKELAAGGEPINQVIEASFQGEAVHCDRTRFRRSHPRNANP